MIAHNHILMQMLKSTPMHRRLCILSLAYFHYSAARLGEEP